MSDSLQLLRTAFLFFFFTIAQFQSEAAPQLSFRHLGIEQGLSQSSVLSITQDKLGNLWFGTQNGLNCYDGYEFTVYKTDYSDPTSLPSGFVGALFTDDNGRVWVGTSAGLSRFDAKFQRFENFSFPCGSVNHICSFGDRLALSTDNGLFFFHPDDDSFESISLGMDCVIRSSFSHERFLLVASDAGLFQFYDGKAVLVPEFSGVDVHAVAPSQDGGWWIGVYGRGLYRTDSRFRVLRHYSGREMLPSNYVRVLHTDTRGRLWVGTYDGLAVYDDLRSTFILCIHDGNPSSLSHNSVRALYSDAQNGIWVGTWFGGVNYWNMQDEKLRIIPVSGESVYGFVTCLCPDSVSRRIWIGTNDDGMFLYSPEQGSVIHPDIPLVSGNVKCIVPGSDGFLYIGMHMGGIQRMNPRTLQVRGYAFNDRAPIKNGCYSLLEIENGKWLVGSLEGLFLFDSQSGDFSPHTVIKEVPELGRRLISVLFRDRSGRIWIGTDEGFWRISPEDGDVHSQAELCPAIGAAGFHVNQIVQDADGRIWMASSRGLVEFSGISEPRCYTVRDGLPDNNVRAVLCGENELWLCSGGKICRLRQDNGALTLINRPMNNEFNEGASCVGADGLFYFGGLGGITRFDPDDMYSNPYSPRPFLTGVSLDRKNPADLERDASGACISLRTHAFKGPLAVRWSVVNMLSYGGDTFYYCMEGLDDQWHKSAGRAATFTNLAPGNYTLHLRSANNEGVLCDGDAVFPIRVLPRWWQSGLFRMLLLLLAFSFLVVVGLLIASLLKARVELVTRKAEIRRLEDNLDKTRDLLSGQYQPRDSDEKSADGEFLHRAERVVVANIDNDSFSSDDFAREMYMSRSKLYARIQETTGGTVAEFIRKIRFDRACTLLLEGRYSVSEISSMVGFSSPSYFATSFRKYTGCLPKEYGKKDRR